MEHIESSTKIYFTKDFTKFSFLKGNRDINEKKVDAIMLDIKSGIDILRYAPIIVNEKMEILDGQHRYMAARKFKANIFYVVNKEIDLSGVAKINSKASVWKNKDFLNSYCDLKRTEYVTFSQLLIEHKGLSIPILAGLLINYNLITPLLNSSANEMFREGQLTLKHFAKAKTILTMLKDFAPYTKSSPYSRPLIIAMQKLIENGKYNHKEMIDKCIATQPSITNSSSSWKEMIAQLETIINFKAKSRILIY